MKVITLAFLLSMAPVVALSADRHEATISGYEADHYAVTVQIGQQLTQKVVAPLSAEWRASDNKGKIEITIVGCADKTGNSAANDELGKKRAEEARIFLSQKFPDAKFLTPTKGDELDSKMVIVTWTLVPAPARSDNNRSGLVGIILFAALAGVGCFLLFRKQPTRVMTPVLPTLTPPPPTEETTYIEVSQKEGGRKYRLRIPVVKRGSILVLPFYDKDDRHKLIEVTNGVSSARFIAELCVKKQPDALQALIASNTIQKITLEEVTL